MANNSQYIANALLELLGKAGSSYREQEEVNRTKIRNDEFFNAISQIIAKNLGAEQLKADLEKFAKENNFSSVNDVLNQVTNSYGVTPLQKAFKDQNFTAANQLIGLGAEFGPRERAEFDVALDSKTARAANGRPSVDSFHQVKRYGLTLGIEMTAKDGTSSQIAHIEPTYKMMAESVGNYSRSQPFNKDFKQIADAFKFANTTGKFSYSTSTNNPKAGHELAARIKAGEVTTVPIACDGHFMGLSFVAASPPAKEGSGYMVYTNRGLGSTKEDCGTQVYAIDDMSKIKPEFLNSMMNGLSNGVPPEKVIQQVRDVAGNKPPIAHIPQQGQKYDNCSIANPRANIQGILLCQKANEKGGFDKLTADDHAQVKTEYKNFTGAMRAEKVEELASAIEKNPKDPDLANIGKEYLKKDPKISDTLKAKLASVVEGANKKVDNDFGYDAPSLSSPS